MAAKLLDGAAMALEVEKELKQRVGARRCARSVRHSGGQ